MRVTDNLTTIQQMIEASCQRSGRTVEEITLIAVTKYVTIERTKEVLQAGITNIAENRDTGLSEKQVALDDPAISWHFIGQLQTKKVKKVINQVDYFHALDRLSLAEEINKRADKVISCFVQVNVSGEESKAGLPPDELEMFIQQLTAYPKIKVVGLMTMAPFTDDESILRQVFRRLRELRDQIQAKGYKHAPCQGLSMGMSNDFHIAIEEGATHIRIGSSLVGTDKLR
ncbi:YggS family pyridoxal phosphate-dependent enzyme [Amphibacillus sediminis]|uniref:YggS family pyridoxal phosphate-dependent enzyme n=1 Tax=Amphibacillus sediminis TaxID=360185 RepID=UPI000831BD9A|nr:YggS family pyridoxal phosphate-dependent enzyme [Amphibacillus sediminis]